MRGPRRPHKTEDSVAWSIPCSFWCFATNDIPVWFVTQPHPIAPPSGGIKACSYPYSQAAKWEFFSSLQSGLHYDCRFYGGITFYG